jgi:glutamyl-tRNA synthetase
MFSMSVTRLAPSPTGALHLGNARTFLLNWLLARQRGWRVLLRIDDLDGPRVKRGAAEAAIEDLRWLGLDWDGPVILQSARRASHDQAIRQLIDAGHAYPCVCTRSEIDRAASAPHADDGAAVYPGTCRGRFTDAEEARRQSGREPAWRIRTYDEPLGFDDEFAGPQQFRVASQLGDFVIAKSDGTPAYQLATVIDDADASVTHVVRGDDLLDSTPRQMLLYRLLGRVLETPRYLHLPLVVGRDGRRLAKRHGDTRLSHYRALGVDPRRLLAMLARWSGVECGETIDLDELTRRFSIDRVPRGRVTFTDADEQRLLQT